MLCSQHLVVPCCVVRRVLVRTVHLIAYLYDPRLKTAVDIDLLFFIYVIELYLYRQKGPVEAERREIVFLPKEIDEGEVR